MTDKKRKTRYRTAALYVEFEFDEDAEAVAAALERAGAQIFEIDLDCESRPRGSVSRCAAVFRIRFEKEKPLCELLSAAAHLPSVHAVHEMPRFL